MNKESNNVNKGSKTAYNISRTE